MKKLVTTASFIVALALTAQSASAITDAQNKAIKKAIVSVTVPEMPAKAAELVQQASKQDRESVAVQAVRSAIYRSRSSASLVVSAVVKVAPEVAAPVTLAASELASSQAGYIAAAAMSAAPAAKTQIIASASQGVSMANTGGNAMALASGNVTSQSSSTITTPSSTPTFINTRSFGGAPVGLAAVGGNPAVNQTQTPINQTGGGNGSGSFTGAGAVHAGTPTEVDYTAPRHQ